MSASLPFFDAEKNLLFLMVGVELGMMQSHPAQLIKYKDTNALAHIWNQNVYLLGLAAAVTFSI